MSIRIIICLVAVFILIATFTISAAVYLTKRKKPTAHESFVRCNKRYKFYYDFSLSRRMFRKVVTQVSNLSVYNFMEIRVQSVKFFERSLILGVSMFVIGFIGLGDIISGLVLFFVAIILINNTVTNRINDVEFQCLRAESKLCSSISENFTRTRNVPDAINEADCPAILTRTVSQIYSIVTANDGRERLDRFYQENQSRVMRTLATTCYLRNDAGDDSAGESPFKQALRLIKDDVNQEVRRLINQRLMFKSLSRLPFIPLFAYAPVKIIFGRMIPATQAVYNSQLGYIIKMAVILTSLICYYVLSTINDTSVARTDDRLSFITRLLYYEKVRAFARALRPKDFKKRRKLQKTLDGCLSQKTAEYIALEKFIFGIGAMVAGFILTIAILISSRAAVYDLLAANTLTVKLTYTAEQEVAMLEYDHALCDSGELPSDEELRKDIKRILPRCTDLELDAQVTRITNKVNSYNSIRFRWWFAFIYIALWFIGHWASDFLLMLRSKLVTSEAELDVLQLQTIIAILMDTTLDTLSVIYWLAKSSDIHKGILLQCYHEYTRDPEMSIINMKRKSAVVDFSAICDKLRTTITQVTLKEAFEDLIEDRANTMQIREAVQMAALKSKRQIASPIAMAPTTVWVIAVFMLPIIVVTIRTAISTMGNLNF